MKKDKIYKNTNKPIDSFEFNSVVAEVFDDMIERSVPFYKEQQSMIKDIIKKFYIPNTIVYDLGCATATTLINIASEIYSQSTV